MSGVPSSGSSEQAVDMNGGAMLDRLQGLLEQQLTLVHQGRWATVVALIDRTDQCVQRIAGTVLPDGPGPTRQWQCIQQLYRELSLALTAQRAEVSGVLNAIRRSKKMLNTYGASLPSS